jgi:single-stranded-DNA-specific exonuclease
MEIKIAQRELQHRLSESDEYSLILRKIFAARGVDVAEELDRSTSKILTYKSLKDIDKAVGVVYAAMQENLQIIVVGDFDSDGATSTALLVSMLRKFGAKNTDFIIPHRQKHGYGLSVAIVEDLLDKYDPGLVITVDNGISNIEGVKKLKDNGINVVITDHHLYSGVLPEADAIVNPNQEGCEFPSKNLAGVGVVFYLLVALRRFLHDNSWFETKQIEVPSMLHQLDLVALGTVADVVPLDENNRLLVHYGLEVIKNRICRVGISALLAIGRRDQGQIIASDLSYCVGPRLNAAGRLADMTLGVRCLLTDDPIDADNIADKLNNLNTERRQIEIEMQDNADESLQKINYSGENAPYAICLYSETWHQGVIGILASRLKESYHRPTAIFTKDRDGIMKGSCRSLAKLNIRDVLCNIAVSHPGIIDKFGGHAMAAGLTIKADKFEEFKEIFNDIVASKLTLDDLNSTIFTDGMLPIDHITLEFAKTLNNYGPWGQAFPEPVFENTFHIIDQRLVGNNHLKLLLEIDETTTVNAILFNADTDLWPNYDCIKAKFAFKLDINEYRGRKQVQLIVSHIDPITMPYAQEKKLEQEQSVELI